MHETAPEADPGRLCELYSHPCCPKDPMGALTACNLPCAVCCVLVCSACAVVECAHARIHEPFAMTKEEGKTNGGSTSTKATSAGALASCLAYSTCSITMVCVYVFVVWCGVQSGVVFGVAWCDSFAVWSCVCVGVSVTVHRVRVLTHGFDAWWRGVAWCDVRRCGAGWCGTRCSPTRPWPLPST